MRIAREEIFGPVMSVIGFKDAEEAVQIANDSIFGLAGAVWCNNINTAHKVAAAVRVGTMGINNYFGGDVSLCRLAGSSKVETAVTNRCTPSTTTPS